MPVLSIEESVCLAVAGPTSFAPVIEKAMTIVEESGGQYHVLLIIADGQVFLSSYLKLWDHWYFVCLS